MKLHPFLFATYASLGLLAANLGQVDLAGIARSLVLALAICGLILIAVRLFIQDGEKASLVTTAIVLLTTSYSHVIRVFDSTFPVSSTALGVSLLWLAIGAAWVFFVLRKLSKTHHLTLYFFAFGLLVNVFPVYALATYSLEATSVDRAVPEYRARIHATHGISGPDDDADATSVDPTNPDIYYIVLDAYTRDDVLQEIYDYDNSPFVSALQERGFFLANASNSNYAITELSLASSLNLAHIADLPQHLEQQGVAVDEQVVRSTSSHLIKNNLVVEFLRSEGYTIVAFDGGYGGAYLGEPDLFLRPDEIEDPNFWQFGLEVILLDTPLGRYMPKIFSAADSPMQAAFDAHRQRVLSTLRGLPEVAARPGPKFVYAHVVSPHVPYVFGRNGERIVAEDPYTLLNARPGAEENIRRYPDQVHYLNGLILDAVEGILQHSERPAVIILQGDHSSKVYSESDPPDAVQLRLEFPILNAYHLPGPQVDWVHHAVSPVNTFRGLFNAYFDTDLSYLPDASYRLQAEDGTVRFVRVCPPPDICR